MSRGRALTVVSRVVLAVTLGLVLGHSAAPEMTGLTGHHLGSHVHAVLPNTKAMGSHGLRLAPGAGGLAKRDLGGTPVAVLAAAVLGLLLWAGRRRRTAGWALVPAGVAGAGARGPPAVCCS